MASPSMSMGSQGNQRMTRSQVQQLQQQQQQQQLFAAVRGLSTIPRANLAHTQVCAAAQGVWAAQG